MNKKLTFEEWFFQCEFRKDGYDCNQVSFVNSAWSFAQSQDQKEAQAKQAMYDEKYTEIHKANVALMDERDIIRKENDSLWVENEDLTRKIEELKKKVDELEKTVSSQTEIIYKLENECSFTYKCPVNSNLQKENESIKKKLEKAEEVIQFYGDPEKWMIKTSDHWTKSNPRTYGDSELIEDYSHPNKDWVGSIVVGGKRARAYFESLK